MTCLRDGKVLGPGPFGLVLSFLFLTARPGPAEAQIPIRDWMVAGPYPADQVARDPYPNFYAIFLAPWREVTADEEGGVDLTAHFPRENPAGDLVIARHVFFSPEDRVLDLAFAYGQEIDLFFNGWRVFSGGPRGALLDSGAPGPLEGGHRVPLHARKGLNEIFLMATGTSGPWGFQLETGSELAPVEENPAVAREIWVTPDTFLTPETVLRDPVRNVLYVSNFDNQYGTRPEPSGYISRLSLEGEILDHRWVTDLNAPTGMDIWRDTLFVAERETLLAIDLTTGAVAGRWPIPDPVFPNDLVIDDQGTIYISDTRTGDWAESRIYRFRDGEFDIFANEGISRANGIWVQDGWLIVGSSGDGLLKRVELDTGRMETILSMGAGIIDGIRVDGAGNLLVSHWEGQLYRISPEGRMEKLLDALPEGWNTADFEFLPEEGVLLIPTFMEDRVRAISIGG